MFHAKFVIMFMICLHRRFKITKVIIYEAEKYHAFDNLTKREKVMWLRM